MPRQLLVIATENLTNNALHSLFELHLDAIVAAFDEADYVELSHDALALGHRTGPADS
jgi:predicted nuclease of predicted toxin-antitoxin system